MGIHFASETMYFVRGNCPSQRNRLPDSQPCARKRHTHSASIHGPTFRMTVWMSALAGPDIVVSIWDR